MHCIFVYGLFYSWLLYPGIVVYVTIVCLPQGITALANNDFKQCTPEGLTVNSLRPSDAYMRR